MIPPNLWIQLGFIGFLWQWHAMYNVFTAKKASGEWSAVDCEVIGRIGSQCIIPRRSASCMNIEFLQERNSTLYCPPWRLFVCILIYEVKDKNSYIDISLWWTSGIMFIKTWMKLVNCYSSQCRSTHHDIWLPNQVFPFDLTWY